MKLLITSQDALISPKTGDFYEGILDALLYFKSQSEDHLVYVLSIHNIDGMTLPTGIDKLQIKPKLRGSPALIEIIKDDAGIDNGDFLILGADNYDLYWAANSKLMLLSANYAAEFLVGNKIFQNEYGIPIKDSKALIEFFKVYNSINTPWFYNLNINTTSVYALTNANTMYKSEDIVVLNEKFKDCLKNGDDTYQLPFLMYFLISTYHIFKELDKVSYWGIYPSSHTGENDDLQYFCTKARQTYGCRIKEPLLIRHKKSSKRHTLSAASRVINGCDDQFDSIVINPYYKGKLKGKTICIIDDFTTYGTSAETARNIFENAGVAKLVFIALGKYGREYHQNEYDLAGDVFSAYHYKKIFTKKVDGTFNQSATKDVLDSIAALL